MKERMLHLSNNNNNINNNIIIIIIIIIIKALITTITHQLFHQHHPHSYQQMQLHMSQATH